jgi:hypothetical protein
MATAVTSGPMPSPPITPIEYSVIEVDNTREEEWKRCKGRSRERALDVAGPTGRGGRSLAV